MSSYKLTYFHVRARAEPIRLMFVQAGVKFEDIRVTGDEWKALKASGNLPFGQLPILEHDGIILSQSGSITRYVADKLGFAPSNAAARAQADMVFEGTKDLFEKFAKIRWESNDEKKEELKKQMFETTLPTQMGFFEKLLKANNEGKGYFFGDKMTYADISIFHLWNGCLAHGKPEVPVELKTSSLLVEHYKKIMAEPKILDWINTREESSI